MSVIRVIYSVVPNFPATDQHPDAVRYTVGGRIVDAIGGQPTQAEIDAFLNPKPDSAGLAGELVTDKAFDDLGRAIDQGDTKTALTLVKQLLQENR